MFHRGYTLYPAHHLEGDSHLVEGLVEVLEAGRRPLANFEQTLDGVDKAIALVLHQVAGPHRWHPSRAVMR